jgi:hypothetical protein
LNKLLCSSFLQDDEDGNSWVLNSKQGFQDCEMYAKLEEWLGRKADEYWDTNFDTLELRKGSERYKADHEWVQCYSCRKWRILNAGFDTKSLPDEWFVSTNHSLLTFGFAFSIVRVFFVAYQCYISYMLKFIS